MPFPYQRRISDHLDFAVGMADARSTDTAIVQPFPHATSKLTICLGHIVPALIPNGLRWVSQRLHQGPGFLPHKPAAWLAKAGKVAILLNDDILDCALKGLSPLGSHLARVTGRLRRPG